jgi:aminoglycoside phosphotransferase (APT) family kinase protein
MIYGKVDADGTGALTVPVVAALRERMGAASAANRFNVPRALGFRPDLQLLLMEALPGRPQVARLLKSRLAGDSPSPTEPLTLEESIQACGRIAAVLHGTGIKLGRRRTIDVEFGWLGSEFQSIQQVIPELGSRLLACLAEVMDFAATLKPQPLCFSHGDFTYTQLIFDGDELGLVDFDTVCQAEPALDVGQFLAYQRLAIRKDGRPEAPMPPEMIERLCGLFLESYIETSGSRLEDEQLFRSRVAIYELISLLRLAIHSWQKLKGNRLVHSMNLVEERLACLTQAR